MIPETDNELLTMADHRRMGTHLVADKIFNDPQEHLVLQQGPVMDKVRLRFHLDASHC